MAVVVLVVAYTELFRPSLIGHLMDASEEVAFCPSWPAETLTRWDLTQLRQAFSHG